MKKLILMSLMMGSFYSYAQNNVYGKYIKAIDSLAVGSGVTSDGGSLTVDEITLDASTIDGVFSADTRYILRPSSGDFNGSGISSELLLQGRGTDGAGVIYGNVSIAASTYPALGFTAAQQSAALITARPLFGFYNGHSTTAVSVYQIDADGSHDYQGNTLDDIGSLTVDQVQIDGQAITTTSGNLSIESPNNITFTTGGGTYMGDIGVASAWNFNNRALDAAGSLDVGNLTLNLNTISSTNTNGNVEVNTNGTGDFVVNTETVGASFNIEFDDNNKSVLATDSRGVLTFSGSSQSNKAGEVSFSNGSIFDIDSLDVHNIITTGNIDLVLAPNGTGILDVESNLSLSDNDLLDVGSGTVASGSFYETGTFTPTVIGTSTAGTATYSIQSGRFTRVGNIVTAYAILVYTGGTGTGSLQVSGLPFTSVNPASSYQPPVSLRLSDIAMTASNSYTGFTSPNSIVISLRQYPTGGGSDTSIPYDAAGTIVVNAVYETTY